MALGTTCLHARQITLFGDDGEPAVQILTSNHTITAAKIVTRMRARWGIENAFKALTAHHGIDQLCDYRMDFIDDTREIDNPDRKTLNAAIAALRAEHKTITGQIGEIVTDHRYSTQTIAQRGQLQDERYMIQDEIDALVVKRNTVPAKTAANLATPGKQRALPKLERRAYQMILRLLTYNALRWLAEQLDTPPTQRSLTTLEWIDRHENLVVCGPSGTGKSHLLEALGHAAIGHGCHVQWFSLETLGALINRHRVDDSTSRAIHKIMRADLICIDLCRHRDYAEARGVVLGFV